MNIILRIIIGSILVAIGSYMVIKTSVFRDFFGSVPFAEKYLGGGGTNIFYKTLGIVILLIGFLWATNLWGAFLNATLGSILPSQEPAPAQNRAIQ
jgi:hypothetical protein